MAFSLGRIPNQGAIPSLSDLFYSVSQNNPNIVTLSSSGTADTLSASSILDGIFVRSGASAAVTVTTDTATNIINQMGAGVFVGMTCMLIYANLNTASGAVTVAGGTGVTTSGTMTIPVAGLRVFVLTVTNITAGSQAVTIQGAFSLGSGVAA